jgi:hypothetical protein
MGEGVNHIFVEGAGLDAGFRTFDFCKNGSKRSNGSSALRSSNRSSDKRPVKVDRQRYAARTYRGWKFNVC